MSENPVAPVIVLAGPTGVGKSRLSLELARIVGGEIVNYDSVQIYRRFDIGSAKPTSDERASIPHHLFDIVEATEEFNAARYAALAEEMVTTLQSQNIRPIFVGGTGFYMRAFLSGLPDLPERNPELRARIRRVIAVDRGRARLHRMLQRVDPSAAARIAPADTNRLERALEVWFLTGQPISNNKAPATTDRSSVPHVIYALALERAELIRRIDERVDEMYARGLIDETAALLTRYPSTARPFTSIGYREALRLLSGEISRESAIAETKRRTRAYSKRQMTWLRGEPLVRWVDANDPDAALRQIVMEQQ